MNQVAIPTRGEGQPSGLFSSVPVPHVLSGACRLGAGGSFRDGVSMVNRKPVVIPACVRCLESAGAGAFGSSPPVMEGDLQSPHSD